MTKCSIWAGELSREGCKPSYNEVFSSLTLFLTIWLFLSVQLSPWSIFVYSCGAMSNKQLASLAFYQSIIYHDLKLLLRGAWLKTVPPGKAWRLGIILSRSKFIRIRIQAPFPRPGFLLWVGKGSRRKADTRQPSPSLTYWDRVHVLWVHN